jgi:hypothetical protein
MVTVDGEQIIQRFISLLICEFIRRKQISDIVTRTKDAIDTLEPLNTQTQSSLDRHEIEVPILREGCLKLNQLKVKRSSHPSGHTRLNVRLMNPEEAASS